MTTKFNLFLSKEKICLFSSYFWETKKWRGKTKTESGWATAMAEGKLKQSPHVSYPKALLTKSVRAGFRIESQNRAEAPESEIRTHEDFKYD